MSYRGKDGQVGPDYSITQTLSNREHRRLEHLARMSDLHRLYAAIADFRTPLDVRKRLLLGTSRGEEIYVEGFLPINRILEHFHLLDPQFNTNASTFGVLTMQKRPSAQSNALRGPVRGIMHGNFASSFPSLCFLNHTGKCNGPIIRAHAIQEAQIKPHADNGKVYFGSPFDRGNDGEVAFKRLTVRTATTFRGFCAHHDSTTFRPIETTPFTGSKEQIFLYHYRALCKDLYLRHVTKNFFSTIAAPILNQGLGSEADFFRQVLGTTQTDIEEFNVGKSQFDAALDSKNFDILSGCWMRGKGVPGLIGTTLVFPTADLAGKPFLNRASSGLQNWISVTTTIETGSPLAIISGMANSPYLTRFLDSVRRVPSDDMASALTRFALSLSENFVLVPKWWEGLTNDERRAARIVFTNRFYTTYFKGKPDWSWDPPRFF